MEESERTDEWLLQKMQSLLQTRFADMPGGYPLSIQFGRRARRRLGSIAIRNGASVITINRLFSNPDVPEYVVLATLAHELAHYAHGFGSGLPRRYSHPHKDGVVDKELTDRGFSEISALAHTWIKNNWEKFYEANCTDLHVVQNLRLEYNSMIWGNFLSSPNRRTEKELSDKLLRFSARLNVSNPAFQSGWLYATIRQKGVSYFYAGEKRLALHGLLADRRAPDFLIDFELAYWLIRLEAGSNWKIIETKMEICGMKETMREALDWRSKRWPVFCRKYHPLRDLSIE